MIEETLKLCLDFDKMNGLIAAVVQDCNTKDVLMVAFQDKEAFERTMETGLFWYFTRTERRVKIKGEISKNYQRIVEARVNCEQESIVYLVEPQGPACHTQRQSCYYRRIEEGKLTLV